MLAVALLEGQKIAMRCEMSDVIADESPGLLIKDKSESMSNVGCGRASLGLRAPSIPGSCLEEEIL